MKRRAFIKLGGQVTVAGTVLTQLSACSSDDDNVKPPNQLDDLDDLGYQGAAPFVHGIASGDPLHDRVILWAVLRPLVSLLLIRLQQTQRLKTSSLKGEQKPAPHLILP